MALSPRAQLESILVRRAGRWLTAAGLDGTTVSGSNDALADPIARAIRVASGTVTDDSNPVDADVATVADADVPLLCDAGELFVLEAALQNFTKVDVSSPAGGAQPDDLGQRMDRARAAKYAAFVAKYGSSVLAPGVTSGSWAPVSLSFGDDDADESSRGVSWSTTGVIPPSTPT